MQSKQTYQAAIRVTFEDKTRRVRLSEVTFACLAKSIAERFETSAALNLGYFAEEDVIIQISSDKDLQCALDRFQRKLRLIAKPAKPAPAIAAPAVQPARVSQPLPVVTVPQPVSPAASESKGSEERSARRKPILQTMPSNSETSLKSKSIRIVSQFFLLKGTDEPNQRKRLVVAPGTKFTKVWKVRNDSNESWPADTRLSFVQGDQSDLRVPAVVRMAGLNPSQETELRVSGKAPKHAGKFTCVFRFTSNDKLVGKNLKIMVVVKEPEEIATQDKEPIAKHSRRQEAKEAQNPEIAPAKETAPRVKRERRPKKIDNAN